MRLESSRNRLMRLWFVLSLGICLPAQAQQGVLETSKDNLLGVSAGKTATVYSPTHVLLKLHGIAQTEIELGTLAQTHAQTDEVRQFGARLVDEHRRLDQKVRAQARSRQIDLSPDNLLELQTTRDRNESAQLQAALAKLRNLQGRDFDKSFRKTVIRAHKRDLDFIEQASQKVDDPALRQLLGEWLPVLRQQQDQARQLGHAS